MIDDAPDKYRLCRFIIQNGNGFEVSVMFYNREYMILEPIWHPDPEESFLVNLQPSFETAEEAFEWIRSGVFMLFPSVADSVFVKDDEKLVAEWSLAEDFARKQNSKGKEEIHIRLDCNEQMERENKYFARIRRVQDQIKEMTGTYPHEAAKSHLDELIERATGLRRSRKPRKHKARKAKA